MKQIISDYQGYTYSIHVNHPTALTDLKLATSDKRIKSLHKKFDKLLNCRPYIWMSGEIIIDSEITKVKGYVPVHVVGDSMFWDDWQNGNYFSIEIVENKTIFFIGL